MEDTITLNIDGKDVECGIVASFPAGERDYVALLPQSPIEGYANDEVLLYRYTRNDDEFNLFEIEDDDEFEIAADAFDELLDEAYFNELSDK